MNHARRDLCGGCSAMGIPTAIGLPRIIQRKENAPEFDYSSFYAKTGAGDPLLCGGGSAFLMRCLRVLFHEETALVSVRKIPLPELTPLWMVESVRWDRYRPMVNT